MTQAEIDALVEKRIAKQRRQHGRELTLLITMCGALASEVAWLRWRLRVERREQTNHQQKERHR